MDVGLYICEVGKWAFEFLLEPLGF